MRAFALAAAALLLALVPTAAAHGPVLAFQCTGCGGFSLTQWSAPTAAPCETLWHGSAWRTTGDPKPIHAQALLGSTVLGPVDIKYAIAEQWMRDDDPAFPGACGAVPPWTSVLEQREAFQAASLSSAILPATIDITWTPYLIQGYMLSGYTPTGTCTLSQGTTLPPSSSTTTIPLDPTTASCTFTVTVPPAPSSLQFDLWGNAAINVAAAGPGGFPYQNYVKAHLESQDALHHDFLDHCVEVTPWSPC